MKSPVAGTTATDTARLSSLAATAARKTSFQYDDAADVYYYETRGWNPSSAGFSGLIVTGAAELCEKAGYPTLARYVKSELLNGDLLNTLDKDKLTHVMGEADALRFLAEKSRLEHFE